MLRWAATFLIIAIVAGIFGMMGVAGLSIEIAKILFFAFLILAVITFLLRGRVSTD